MRPRVGILGNDGRPVCERWAKPLLERGVGVEIITPTRDIDAKRTLTQFDGLLLPGGFSNVHPSFVGRMEMDEDDYDVVRDEAAVALVRAAYDMDFPTLGICRGMQEMVAAYGGALEKLENLEHAANYQYAGDHKKMNTPVHDINFVEGKKLRELFDGLCDAFGRVRVNSIHHEGITLQGIARRKSSVLRQKFDIEAVSHDDVVEALSGKGKSFFIGVQAHFELSEPKAEAVSQMHERLFDCFANHIIVYHENRVSQLERNLCIA